MSNFFGFKQSLRELRDRLSARSTSALRLCHTQRVVLLKRFGRVRNGYFCLPYRNPLVGKTRYRRVGRAVQRFRQIRRPTGLWRNRVMSCIAMRLKPDSFSTSPFCAKQILELDGGRARDS